MTLINERDTQAVMKNWVLIFFLYAGIFLPTSVLAQNNTPAELSSKIQELLIQIQSLELKIKSFNQEGLKLGLEAKEFKSRMFQGVSGDEVRLLQEVLSWDKEVYPEAIVSGYYGNLTKKAVIRFQIKNGIEGVGEVGPKTRQALNEYLKRNYLENAKNSTSSYQDKITPTSESSLLLPSVTMSPSPTTVPQSGGGGGPPNTNTSPIPEPSPDTLPNPEPSPAPDPKPQPKEFEELAPQGDILKTGVADASLEYGGTMTGWMAYSSVDFTKPQRQYVATHIAKSQDLGLTWQFTTVANSANDIFQNGSYIGTWRNETPSLVYIPTETPDKRWKLYYQRYLAAPSQPGAYLFNIVAYQYAATPTGPWSQAVCILGDLSGCNQNLGIIDSELSNMVFFNELGTLYFGEKLYLSMDVSPSNTGVGTAQDLEARKIILLSSANHGVNWQYVGILTDFSDAVAHGYVTFTASSLVLKDGIPYLLITPSGSINGENKAHDGSYLVKIDDIDKAKVARDDQGKISFLKIIKPTKTRGGQSDYDEKNTGGGVVMSQIDLSDNIRPFKLYDTFESISDTD